MNKKKVLGLFLLVFCLVSSVFADPLTIPDMGVTAGDILDTGVTEAGSVMGTGLAFAVGIMILFFGYRLLKRVMKPA